MTDRITSLGSDIMMNNLTYCHSILHLCCDLWLELYNYRRANSFNKRKDAKLEKYCEELKKIHAEMKDDYFSLKEQITEVMTGKKKEGMKDERE